MKRTLQDKVTSLKETLGSAPTNTLVYYTTSVLRMPLNKGHFPIQVGTVYVGVPYSGGSLYSITVEPLK